MIIHCINTGSSGNCYLVEYEPKRFFMLDCGVAATMIEDYLRKIKSSPTMIDFCLISHLHIDHLENDSFINLYSIPVYLPKVDGKNEIVNKIYKNLINYIGIYERKKFSPKQNKNLIIEPFLLPHDAYNLGYKITLPNDEKMVYMTDFGNIKPLPIFIDKIDYFMVECNYGDETIKKIDNLVSRRSKSDTGHCSNLDCLTYLQLQPRISKSNVLLVHRSMDNLKDPEDYEIFKDLNCKSLTIMRKKQAYNFESINKKRG